MLDYLRKKKRSWIITFLLGAIIIVFIAFYGGSSKFQDARLQDVAQVNGEPITQLEFNERYQRAVDRYRDMLKGSLTPEMLKSLNLKGTLLEDMIQQKLALQEARKMGLMATDDELADIIGRMPEFQVMGRFNKERYLMLLRANRLTPEQFEEDQRDQITIQRLYSVLLDSVQVPDSELRTRFRFEQEKINLSFIRFPASTFLAQVKLNDDDIKKYYESRKESFKEPAKVQVEYLSYPFAKFAAAAEPAQKEIEDYYQANRESKFHKPQQAKVRIISIPVAPGADPKEKEAALVRARRLVADARAGKDFAQLVNQDSKGLPGPAPADLGWVNKGQLPPALDGPIFNLQKGQVSDVIETPQAVQIIKVEDTKEARTENLQQATDEIKGILKTEKGKRDAATAADRDREKALGGTDFTKLAQQSGVPLAVTRPFSAGEMLPEVGQNQDFYKTALSMGAKDVSPVIEGSTSYYLMRIKEKKDALVPPLEAVRPQIERELTNSKAYELARQKASAVLDQLKKEKDIGKVAAADGLSVEETGWFLRNAPQLPKLGEFPDLKANGVPLSSQKPIAEKVYTQKDAAYVFAFKESEGADMARFEKEKDQLAKQAVGEAKQRIAQKFIETLKANAKIQVNSDILEQG
jgi:peptidyl-prolyl cis-trans isomerase D